MERTVFVSMLDYDWAGSSMPFTEKVLQLQKLCAKTSPSGVKDPNPLHVVLAPEYTFRKNPAEVVRKVKDSYFANARTPQAVFTSHKKSSQKSTLYTKAEKELLIFHMCSITRGKNVLVIPGTIFWEESAPIYQPSSSSKKQVLQQKGVARNSAFVIYRGEVLAAYHKQVDSHEFDSFEEKPYEFRHGINSGIFNVSGLNVGVEICADHSNSGNLRTALIANNNSNMTADQRFMHNKLTTPNASGAPTEFGLDLQILVSDGMDFNASNAAIRKGGFALHCDTRLPKSVYERPEVGTQKRIDPLNHNYWSFNFGASKSFRDAKASLEQNLKFKKQ